MNVAARRLPSLRALVAALGLAGGSLAMAAEYGTAFTYQGALKSSGVAMNGLVDFEFRIYDVASLGVPLAAPIAMADVPVSDGVFTVQLDFGDLPQSAEERWLEIVVNSTILSPRQKFSPSPLAQASLRVPLVFGGQIQESPYWSTSGGGAFALPTGTSEAVYAESRAQMVMPSDCVARNLHVRNLSTGGYASTTVTLRVNGVATLLACSQISGSGVACSNTDEQVAIEAGDLVSMHFTPNLPTRPLTNSETETRGLVGFGWMCE